MRKVRKLFWIIIITIVVLWSISVSRPLSAAQRKPLRFSRISTEQGLSQSKVYAVLVTGFSSGANDYLAKPFSKHELLARIKTHLHLLNLNKSYSRFVPFAFMKELGRDNILDVKLGDQVQKEMTILFSDIRSYTTLSESMTPQDTFNFLNGYLGRIGPVIQEYKGFVSQYLGDGIMAIFPDTSENYEIYDGDSEDMITQKMETQTEFEKGQKYYFEKEFMEAVQCFRYVLKYNPDDMTARLFLDRAIQLQIEGVPDDWEGVEELTSK